MNHARSRTAPDALRHAVRVFAAETLKQHRRLFGNRWWSSRCWSGRCSNWPRRTTRCVPWRPRPGRRELAPGGRPERLLAFLATGTLAYAFFFSLVQSAWHLSFERSTGTLELLFLSPAGRLTLMIANGAGALLQNAWLLTCFTVAALTGFGTLSVSAWWMYGIVFLALLVPAVAWARSSTACWSSRATRRSSTRSSTSRSGSSRASASRTSPCRRRSRWWARSSAHGQPDRGPRRPPGTPHPDRPRPDAPRPDRPERRTPRRGVGDPPRGRGPLPAHGQTVPGLGSVRRTATRTRVPRAVPWPSPVRGAPRTARGRGGRARVRRR